MDTSGGSGADTGALGGVSKGGGGGPPIEGAGGGGGGAAGGAGGAKGGGGGGGKGDEGVFNDCFRLPQRGCLLA